MTTIIHGDCIEVMATMDAASVDAIVCDPPYELGFMGKRWDGTGIAFDPATWEACLRVLKPGGHLLAFSGTRTSHRMVCAIEDAGFEIRDSLVWMFGSGFPKSLDVGKAIDKAAGAEREVVGIRPSPDGNPRKRGKSDKYAQDGWTKTNAVGFLSETAPATDAAKQWQGWGTALKPGHEPICLARKPLGGKTVAANVLTHGTGALNIDACRIETEEALGRLNHSTSTFNHKNTTPWVDNSGGKGRWPANVVLDEISAAQLDAMSGERPSGSGIKGRKPGATSPGVDFQTSRKYRTAGIGGDTGGASRFFFMAQSDQENPDSSDRFMVQYDCNCEATEGGEWVKQDQRASIQAASDTPPKRDTTASTSGTASEDALLWHTSLNGNVITDLSPTDSRFTTATATSKTTESKTCNCSIASPTSAFTQDANSAMVNGGSPATSAANSSPSTSITGISAERDGHSTDDAAPVISAKSLLINSGDVTRFAYVPKASRAERSAGLDTPSNHPTVKPLSLMRWLVRLVTPPGGVVLDPFAGSGTTGAACALEGFNFIGIEQDAEYVEIARKRIAHWTPDTAQLSLLEQIA